MITEHTRFTRVIEPTLEIADALTRWENDPDLIPRTRPNRNKEALETHHPVTVETLEQRLKYHRMYLIFLGTQLIGEMNYQIDPAHLFKKEPGTAWIGIVIGEAQGRGKGIGFQALQHLEQQIIAEGLYRIELGVFEFNAPAIALYQRAGYKEIGKIPDFTYWEGRMWQDIRMEKYLSNSE